MSLVGRTDQPCTLKYKPVKALCYYYDIVLQFTRHFESRLTDFSAWERFPKCRGEPEVRLPWDIRGPLGKAGVAECDCMALW